MKRTPLTLEEHQALGAELRALHNRLCKLTVDLDSRYPHKVSTRVKAVTYELSRLRSDLDSLVFKENPGQPPEKLVKVYYGGGRTEGED